MKNEEKGNEKGCLEAVKEMLDKFRNSEEYKEHAGKNKKGKETQGGGGYIELRVIKTEKLRRSK